MSCVVVLKKDDRILFGADTLVSRYNYANHVKDIKLFKNKYSVYGLVGSARLCNVLKHNFNPPVKKVDESTEEYIHTSYIDELRRCFINSYIMKSDEPYPEDDSGTFLTVIDDRVFKITRNFYVEEILDYCAIGSGEEYAYGSLFSTIGEKSETRIEKAIKSASYYCPTVGIDNKIDTIICTIGE